jgi:amino acid adenylation domain-containing protein
VAFLVHQLLSEAAAAAPERTAVRCRGDSLTYVELETSANGLARALIGLGAEPGDRVGIWLPKQIETMAALYAALKAGGIFVPIDPSVPPPYAASVAADCEAKFLVTTPSRAAELLPLLGKTGPAGMILVGEDADLGSTAPPSVSYAQATADPSCSDPRIRRIDADIACLLYTSGSTGRPKGVMHTHRAVLTVADWYVRIMGITQEDRLVVHAPLHFVMAPYGIFPAALAGATSVLVSLERAFRGSDLAKFIREERISVWHSVPYPLRHLIEAGLEPGSLPTLRIVGCGGGTLRRGEARRLRELLPGAQLWQFYGATEVWGAFHNRLDLWLDADGAGDVSEDGPVSIGLPIDNVDAVVVRDDGGAAGPGDEGELYVRSGRVMAGYWGDPERTDQVLVRDPLGRNPTDRLYRTGDRMRIRRDGGFHFIGRRDRMVKSRGYRIELAEIEAALHSHPDVLEAMAVPVEDPERGTLVVGCVEARDGSDLAAGELAVFLAGRLPGYMVPSRFDVRARLPRTSTGKVDGRRLADENARPMVGTTTAEPATADAHG